MKTPLFVDRVRQTTPREQQPSESCFQFIDRLDLPELDGTRTFLNGAIERLPMPLVSEFVARLKSKKQSDYSSSCFELALLDAIRRNGLSAEFCLSSSQGSQPDIVVLEHERVLGYIEATVVGQQDDHTLFRFIQSASQRVQNRHLRIAVRHFCRGSENPRPSNFATFVDAEGTKALANANRDLADLQRIAEDLQYSEDSGTRAVVNLHWARTAAPPNKVLLLSLPFEAYWGQGRELLQERMQTKRKQHRGIETTLLLAIGWQNFKHEVTYKEYREIVNSTTRSSERKTNCLLMAPRFSMWSPQTTHIELWVSGGKAEPEWVQHWTGPVMSD